MADKRTESEALGGGRRKRAAPTIDLTATEVKAEAKKAAHVPERSGTPSSKTNPEPKPTSSAAPSSEPTSAEAVPAAPASEPRPGEPGRSATEIHHGPEAAAEPPHASHAPSYGLAFVAGVAGALIVAGVLAGLWYSGQLPLPANGQAAKVAALEQTVQALRHQPPSAANSKAIDALRAQVNQLADTVANLPLGHEAVSARLATVEGAIKQFGATLSALQSRNDATAADAKQARQSANVAQKAVSDLRASLQNIVKNASGSVPAAALEALQKQVDALDLLQKRVAALEQSMQAAQAKLAKNSATDRAARLALSAAALRDAVASGAPFAAELEQAKAFDAGDTTLAPLERFASSGVPSKTALARQLSALIPAMSKLVGQSKTSGSFLDRLQANARKLVRIEPVTAPQGHSSSDVLARIEVDAAKADTERAVADLAQLPPGVRAPAQDWIARVRARRQALAAAQRFAADTARALGKT